MLKTGITSRVAGIDDPLARAYLDAIARSANASPAAESAFRLPDARPGRDDLSAREWEWLPGVPVREAPRPTGIFGADHATELTARTLIARPELARGRSVLEIGCGTGILLALTGRLGAVRLVGTEIDEAALSCARATLVRNGTRANLALCDMDEGVPPADRFDLIIANLPQKPCHAPDALPVAQDGGPDGTRLLRRLLEAAPGRLAPDGRLLLILHTLCDAGIWDPLAAAFDVEITAWRRRFSTAYDRGPAWGRIRELASEGNSFLDRSPDGEYFILLQLICKVSPTSPNPGVKLP